MPQISMVFHVLFNYMKYMFFSMLFSLKGQQPVAMVTVTWGIISRKYVLLNMIAEEHNYN